MKGSQGPVSYTHLDVYKRQNIGTMIVTNILPDNLVNITAGNAGLIITLYMLIMLVINGIQLAVYHMITEYVLTNKLNLE